MDTYIAGHILCKLLQIVLFRVYMLPPHGCCVELSLSTRHVLVFLAQQSCRSRTVEQLSELLLCWLARPLGTRVVDICIDLFRSRDMLITSLYVILDLWHLYSR